MKSHFSTFKKKVYLCIGFIFFSLTLTLQAQTLSVTNLVKNNAVLQRNTKANIWGKGKPGNTVTIKLGNDNNVTTKIKNNGTWSVKIPTGNAGGPYKLSIKDATKSYDFSGILLGEVWLCSGQSNMDMPMKGWDNQPINNGPTEIANAKFPDIRLFKVPLKPSYNRETSLGGNWTVCNPNSVKNFSAVAYFFAKEIHQKLKVPVGVIVASRGNSKGEAWTTAKSLTSVRGFENVIADLDVARQTPDKGKYRIVNINGGFIVPEALYNGMIHPVTPYTIKGVNWYQGESNTGDPDQYKGILKNLISAWRSEFDNQDLPFYVAQIAPYDYKNKKSQELRETQFLAQNISNTGMVSLLDVGEINGIHPAKKQKVGQRLAYWALAKQYGKNIVFSGPTFRSATFNNGKGILKFDYADGLKLTNDDNFEIAGSNGNFVKATAVVKNGAIEVSASNVSNPTQARYGWSNFVKGSLFNGANIPSSSFRTGNAVNPPTDNTRPAANIANGIYYIQDPSGNVKINSPSGRTIDKANVTSNSAKWQFTKVGNYYTIKNQRNNEFLEVPYEACNANDKPQNPNINLGTWTSANSNHQRWNITKVGDNYFLQPLHCEKVVDRNNSKAIHLWPYQAGNSQQTWRIVSASGTPPISTPGDVYIDGENASIRQSDGYINDEGRTLRWQNQGDGQNLPKIDSSIKRAGSNSVAMQINGASTGSTSQRSEYCLNACWQTSEPSVKAGDTWYTGLSFQLDAKTWADPTSWFVIQQTQQKKSPGQKNNNPFVSLEIKKGNKLDVRVASGKNGDSNIKFTHKEIITLKKGVWYDAIVGFKFSPNSNNGFLAVWIKTADQTTYKRYGLDNIKVGYTDAPQQVSQNKTGIYRGRVGGTNKMYFDEVRFSTNLEGAKIPTNTTPPSNDCKVPYKGNNFTVSNQTKTWSSGVINMSCASKADISLDIQGTGDMEVADYLNVFYKVNGGTEQSISQNTDSFTKKTVTKKGITGNTVEIIVKGKTSATGEVYSVSNIRIDDGGNPDPNPPTNDTRPTANIANGIYYIQDPSGNVKINSPSGRTIDKANVTSNSAKWQFTKVGNYYTIKNQRNNEFLEVPYEACNANDKPQNPNINLGTFTSANSNHQRWNITKVGDNYFLQPLHCEKVVDRNNSKAIHLWPYQAGNGQQTWRIVSTTVTPPTVASGDVYIDGEDASIRQSDGYLNDEGRSLRWQNQGDGQNLPKISNVSRAGSKSVEMKISGINTTNGVQRSEYCLNSCYSTAEPALNPGDTHYTGFSIKLAADTWDDPASWFVLQQAQQAQSSGQKGNYPFVAFEIKSGNMLHLASRSGKNGNTQRNPAPSVSGKDLVAIKKGIWYDIIIGWEYSPNAATGWIACWTKTADQSKYTKYSINNIKHGYYGAPQRMEQNKIGMYRQAGSGNNKIFIDEVRHSTNLEGAKIPTNTTPPSSDCKVPYKGNNFTVSNETKTWSSGIIDMSCVSKANISLDIQGTGDMEVADYLNVFYKVDGGTEQSISKNTDSFTKKTVTKKGITGNTVEIIVRGKTSATGEVYSISNIRIDDGRNTNPPTNDPRIAANIANGVYYIQDPSGNVSINSPSGRTINKENSTGNSAKWVFTKVGEYYTIKNQRNNEYLEVPYEACNANDKPQNPNVNLGTWTSAGNTHQQWNITKIGDNYFLQPLHCEKVVDRNNSKAIHLWPYEIGNSQQNWKIVSENNKGLTSKKIQINSNPVSNGVINLTHAKGFLYTIKNISGQSVQSGTIDNDTIDASILSAGIYIIQFYTNGITQIKKVVIM
ncbi:T9SS C-terminal target domain-containing protein [Aquimarina sp. AD10]|uniref:heparin lyase I family protein n=1 Tax=Aquimarina sp. AD10 TaxID=1714849 RepID=UPI000E522D4B|nr:heparin lyase I family protein [Aquimarina sp. AD10]AXT60932.1 T9SS C-terminal target domain-containing protein [Aquimarina sp. AD10]RKM95574.1 T9SS C-terminal target domain-containing protein [Aquimarina sp. AD10]